DLPPLVGDDRDIHRVEDLVGRVRLDNSEWLTLIDNTATQISDILLLIGGRLAGARERLTASLPGRRAGSVLLGRHWNTPALFSSAMRRSEEHTSELQSRENHVCRLLLEIIKS